MTASKILVAVVAAVAWTGLAAPQALAGPGGGTGLAVCDFSGDGIDDIVFVDSTGTAGVDTFIGFWFLSTFTILDGYGLPLNTDDFEVAAVGYFNDDQFCDVLIKDKQAGPTLGNLTEWLMDTNCGGPPGCIGSTNALGNPLADSTVIGARDTDMNGSDDILYRFGTGATAGVAISLLNADGTIGCCRRTHAGIRLRWQTLSDNVPWTCASSRAADLGYGPPVPPAHGPWSSGPGSDPWLLPASPLEA